MSTACQRAAERMDAAACKATAETAGRLVVELELPDIVTDAAIDAVVDLLVFTTEHDRGACRGER